MYLQIPAHSINNNTKTPVRLFAGATQSDNATLFAT